MKSKHSFSLTELLAVVAVILVLISLLIVTVGEAYGIAERLACQQKLEQIDHACRLFSNANHGRELRCLDLLGSDTGRWYEKLIPFLGAGTVDEAKVHLNCPSADATETSPEAATAGRSQNMPILIYASGEEWSYNSYYALRDHLNTFWPGGCHWATYAGSTGAGPSVDDNWLWQQNGLNTYGQFWFFGVIYEGGAFTQGTPDPERIKEFREGGGGGIFMAGDHDGSLTGDGGYGGYSGGINKIADHCKLGICINHGRPHNQNVTWSGHYIGTGLASEPGPAGAPPGDINLSVGRVMCDSRVDDERKTRHQYVSFPYVCRGVQPEGGHGMSYPSCTHEQPCAHIGVMDDGLGRVVVDGTFTRWRSTYFGNNESTLGTLAEQIATWLSGGHGRGGNITYGYNNQIGIAPQGKGLGPTTPEPGRTIRVLDYMFDQADHDGEHGGDDDITCIAARHGGRANVLFADGHVEALTPDEIMDQSRAHWDVQK